MIEKGTDHDYKNLENLEEEPNLGGRATEADIDNLYNDINNIVQNKFVALEEVKNIIYEVGNPYVLKDLENLLFQGLKKGRLESLSLEDTVSLLSALKKQYVFKKLASERVKDIELLNQKNIYFLAESFSKETDEKALDENVASFKDLLTNGLKFEDTTDKITDDQIDLLQNYLKAESESIDRSRTNKVGRLQLDHLSAAYSDLGLEKIKRAAPKNESIQINGA